MTAPGELEVLDVLFEDQVEPVVRAARSGIARLTLAVRAGTQQLRAFESRSDDDAVALLESSLDEQLEKRRAELEWELEEERAVARALVGEARREAVVLEERARRAEVRDEDLRATERRQLQAVNVVSLRPDLPVESVDVAASIEAAPVAVGPTAAESTAGIPAGDSAIVEQLRELIRVEVAAGVRRTIDPAAGHPRSVEPVVSTVRPSVTSRLFHGDVLLPLIASVIVFVILLAWVG